MKEQLALDKQSARGIAAVRFATVPLHAARGQNSEEVNVMPQ